MKKRIWVCICLTGCLILLTASLSKAAGFSDVNPTEAAGYYQTDDYELLLLAGGEGYSIDLIDGADIQGPYHFSVRSDGENFLVCDEINEQTACFVKRPDKGQTPDGGTYYAVYMECVGKTDEVPFYEGRQVQYDGWVFDNDYELFVRKPVSFFYGMDGSNYGWTSIQAEGDGATTPETAVSSYIWGMQGKNVEQMLGGFAIESFVKNYSTGKLMEQFTTNSSAPGFVPTVSDFSLQMIIEQRRANIMDDILAHYLVMTRTEMPVEIMDSDRSVSEMEFNLEMDLMDRLMTVDDSRYFSDRVIDTVFISPGLLNEDYQGEENQQKLKALAEEINADEVRSVAAFLEASGYEYLLCMDTVRYGNLWYILQAGGNLADLMDIDAMQAGLKSIEGDEMEQFRTLMG